MVPSITVVFVGSAERVDSSPLGTGYVLDEFGSWRVLNTRLWSGTRNLQRTRHRPLIRRLSIVCGFAGEWTSRTGQWERRELPAAAVSAQMGFGRDCSLGPAVLRRPLLLSQGGHGTAR